MAANLLIDLHAMKVTGAASIVLLPAPDLAASLSPECSSYRFPHLPEDRDGHGKAGTYINPNVSQGAYGGRRDFPGKTAALCRDRAVHSLS
jgi:hypothetical protein